MFSIPRRWVCLIHVVCAGRVETIPVGFTLRCAANVCDAWHSRDLVLNDVTRANPDVRGSVLNMGGSPLSKASTAPLDGFVS